MTAPTIDPAVASAVEEYVSAVRRELDDLGADDREDLVDGLAADLLELGGELAAERATEQTVVLGQPAPPPVAAALAGRVGEPADYARELRSAAGLAPRGRRLTPVSRRSGGLQRWWQHRLESPGVVAAVPVLRDMRPAWWVLRAWVAVQFIDLAFGAYPYGSVPQIGGGLLGGPDLIGFAVLVAAVVASVQIGRGAWLRELTTSASGRRLIWFGNVALALALLLVVAYASPGYAAATYVSGGRAIQSPARAPSQGLVLDGQRVSNVFAYDAQGQPLTGVRLYDQDGAPLAFDRRRPRGGLPDHPDRSRSVPVQTSRGEAANVSPLPVILADLDRAGEPRLLVPPPPLLEVGPLKLSDQQRELAQAYDLLADGDRSQARDRSERATAGGADDAEPDRGRAGTDRR